MKGDILACYGYDTISELIEKVTNSNTTHIAVKISDKYIMESSWFGVKLSKITRLNNQFTILRDKELNDNQRQAFVNFVVDAVDVRFDYKLLFGIGLNRVFGLKTDWDDKSKYICDELVLEGYKQALNIDLFPDKINIVPGDLVQLSRFELLKPDLSPLL